MSRTNGYGFKDAGDKRHGVWTSNEEASESARRMAAQEEAATAALAETQVKIDAIRADATLTDQGKLHALRMLTASGYSNEEFRVLRAAQERG